MAKVSIVTPVYNVAPYLSNFIESVIGQTFTDWELLLVNDGSTDDSGQICDNYTQKDDRIRVFHKQNGGVSSARNVGLKNMRGDWVLMPDPDDELPVDSIDTLMANTSDDIDLVSASYKWYNNGELKVPSNQSQEMLLSRDEFISMMGISPQPRNLDRRCCNKLFRASIIRDNTILFHEDMHYREDVLYNYQFLEKTRKIKCISYDMYYYYMRDDGANISLKRRYEPKSDGRFLAMTRCYNLLEQIGASTETKKRMQNEITNAYIALITLMKKSRLGFFCKERIGVRKVLLNYISPAGFVSIGKDFVLRRLKKLFII